MVKIPDCYEVVWVAPEVPVKPTAYANVRGVYYGSLHIDRTDRGETYHYQLFTDYSRDISKEFHFCVVKDRSASYSKPASYDHEDNNFMGNSAQIALWVFRERFLADLNWWKFINEQ